MFSSTAAGRQETNALPGAKEVYPRQVNRNIIAAKALFVKEIRVPACGFTV